MKLHVCVRLLSLTLPTHQGTLPFLLSEPTPENDHEPCVYSSAAEISPQHRVMTYSVIHQQGAA